MGSTWDNPEQGVLAVTNLPENLPAYLMAWQQFKHVNDEYWKKTSDHLKKDGKHMRW